MRRSGVCLDVWVKVGVSVLLLAGAGCFSVEPPPAIEPSVTCGDGERARDEACDGSDFGALSCVAYGFTSGELLCDPTTCTISTAACVGDNGVLEPVCGNSKREPGEACDGDDFGGVSCATYGYTSGELDCADTTCQIDTAACIGDAVVVQVCGNNTREPGEACDGGDLGGDTCESKGFYGGVLACALATCQLDVSGCTSSAGQVCGDGAIQLPEQCDGDDVGGVTCEDGSPRTCREDCKFADCAITPEPSCGDSLRNQDEEGIDCGGVCDPCAVEMKKIPEGYFDMGTLMGDPQEGPVHTVWVSNFYIDVHEVTVGEYRACVQRGACTAPAEHHSESSQINYGSSVRDNHPINGVTWAQANTYCQSVGKRLPTEAEWEKAARGTNERRYPWGDNMPTCMVAVMNDGGAGCGGDMTWPVGSKPAGKSPYDIHDMAGNVNEWVADWYSDGYYSVSPGQNPTGPNTGVFRIIRGGGFTNTQFNLRTTFRSAADPKEGKPIIGFRCAKTM